MRDGNGNITGFGKSQSGIRVAPHPTAITMRKYDQREFIAFGIYIEGKFLSERRVDFIGYCSTRWIPYPDIDRCFCRYGCTLEPYCIDLRCNAHATQ